MSFLKLALLSSILLFLTVVQAQEDYFENYNEEPNVRIRRDMEDLFLRGNPRPRRDAEYVRHRRQGGHGGHGGGNGGGGHEGITGPVHTFVKTDEHAHFKWGVRHHVGHEYAGRR